MAKRKRSEADKALLVALACGATVENAAQRAGVAERTAYRRLADPRFRARLAQARADMVQRTAGLLTGAGVGSVKTLVDLQNDAAVSPGVRRACARDVLEIGLRVREAADLEARLAALEERVSKAAGDPRGQVPPMGEL
jgi:hypothetical protein